MKITNILTPLYENYSDLQKVFDEVKRERSEDMMIGYKISNNAITLFSASGNKHPVDAYKSLVQRNLIKPPHNDTGYWINIIRSKKHQGLNEFLKFLIDRYSDIHKKHAAKHAADSFETIYKNQTVNVMRPLTWEAARKLGRGTHWCTSGSTDEHFKEYTSDGELFYVFATVNGQVEKYAIQVGMFGGEDSTSVWTAGNDEISYDEFTEILEQWGIDVEEFWDKIWNA